MSNRTSTVMDHGSLQIKEQNGDVLLVARHTGQGAVCIYNAAGGSNLTGEQAKVLRDWLDDGSSSVVRAENGRLLDELEAAQADLARLRSHLEQIATLNVPEIMSRWARQALDGRAA